MSDRLDRDFGAPDDRTWTLPELYDEIARLTVDAIEDGRHGVEPLLRVLVDLAAIRAHQTPEPNERN